MSKSQPDRRDERAARPARAGTLLCRLPCGGELFVHRSYRPENEPSAREFEKGLDAFAGLLRLYCPSGEAYFHECQRLAHLRELLVSLGPYELVDADSAATPGSHDGDPKPDGLGELAPVSADGFGDNAPLVRISRAYSFTMDAYPALLRGLAEHRRKRREFRKCLEDFGFHAGDSSTGGDMLSPRHEVAPATNA